MPSNGEAVLKINAEKVKTLLVLLYLVVLNSFCMKSLNDYSVRASHTKEDTGSDKVFYRVIKQEDVIGSAGRIRLKRHVYNAFPAKWEETSSDRDLENNKEKKIKIDFITKDPSIFDSLQVILCTSTLGIIPCYVKSGPDIVFEYSEAKKETVKFVYPNEANFCFGWILLHCVFMDGFKPIFTVLDDFDEKVYKPVPKVFLEDYRIYQEKEKLSPK